VPKGPPLEPPSRRQHALSALRSAIVTGRLAPGHRLVETELAAELGVSRAPVREALRQLEQEGLVASSPYRGTEVLGVTREEVAEVLVPVRLTIECFAFRKALPLLTDADLEALAALVETMRRAAAAGDLDALADADVRFHELVIGRSQQVHCLQIWRTIEPRVRAYFRRDASRHATPADVVAQHETLLAALRARDEEHVLAAIEHHVRDHVGPG
jgi:DNA-binding GntR family transcriptional regulator